MNTLVKLILIAIYFLLQDLNAQELKENFKRYDYYFSLGTGISILENVPSMIHQETHSNFQIGVLGERNFNEKFSIITGIELERSIYSLDADFEPFQRSMTITLAPDGLKYAKLYTFNIGVPIQGRYYFKPNLRKQSNIFLQGGIRLSFAGSTYFEYRENNKTFEESLSQFQNNFLLQIEFMIGFKGDFFDNIAILNSSSLGVIYQTQPIFDAGTNIKPVHFTWRFLF
jgi:hypothetical protein